VTPDELLALAVDRLPEPPYVVAVSGGPDSAVLAWIAVHHHGDEVALVHVNHGWEGSNTMQNAALEVAALLGPELEIVTVSAGPTETQARDARLTALRTVAAGRPIATGHHRDDNAETVVGNLMRGAGATGLAGMLTVRPGFARPLIEVGRDAIRAVADALELPYRDDPANDDPTHRRNRIRREVLPALESSEPGVGLRLTRAAEALAADDAELEAIAERIPVYLATDGAVHIPYGPLVTAPPPVAVRAVRRALRAAHPPYAGTAADVAAVTSLGRRGTVALTESVDAIREGADIVLVPHDRDDAVPETVDLAVPGVVEFGRHRIAATVADTNEPIVGRRGVDVVIPTDGLVVRTPEIGDRVDLKTGTKLVSDALSEARVPRRHRKGWPVVASHGRIIWLAEVRVAFSAAKGAASADVVRLVAERQRCSTTFV